MNNGVTTSLIERIFSGMKYTLQKGQHTKESTQVAFATGRSFMRFDLTTYTPLQCESFPQIIHDSILQLHFELVSQPHLSEKTFLLQLAPESKSRTFPIGASSKLDSIEVLSTAWSVKEVEDEVEEVEDNVEEVEDVESKVDSASKSPNRLQEVVSLDHDGADELVSIEVTSAVVVEEEVLNQWQPKRITEKNPDLYAAWSKMNIPAYIENNLSSLDEYLMHLLLYRSERLFTLEYVGELVWQGRHPTTVRMAELEEEEEGVDNGHDEMV